MLRLAWFSALPPTRSGIADYSVELLPLLARHFDVTIYHEELAAVDASLRAQFDIRPITHFPRDFYDIDIPLYQMGNHPQHQAALYEIMRSYPGILVLHDFALTDFMWHNDAERAYQWESDLATLFEVRHRPILHQRDALPLNRRLLELSLGVIVHSQYAAQMVRATSSTPVQYAPLLVQKPADSFVVTPHPLTFAMVGIVNRDKHLDLCLRCFGRIHAEHPDVQFTIIGQPAGVDVAEQIAALPVATQQNVTHKGYVPDKTAFHQAIADTDIVLALRHPTQGETSAGALRALSLGKPVIVFEQGWYAELPGDVAVQVDVMDEDGVEAAMRRLLDAQLREQMSLASADFIENKHAPIAIAAKYAAFIEQRYTALAEFRSLGDFQTL
jgi:glycosyltransferase involved in cell wall biosynthesis